MKKEGITQEEEKEREKNDLLNFGIHHIYEADELISTPYLPSKECLHVKSVGISISDYLYEY